MLNYFSPRLYLEQKEYMVFIKKNKTWHALTFYPSLWLSKVKVLSWKILFVIVQLTLSSFSLSKNANPVEKVISIEVRPTIFRSGSLYLFILYVESIMSIVGNMLNNLMESQWVQNTSQTISPSSHTYHPKASIIFLF